MKAISELTNEVLNPTGNEYLVVSRYESGGYQTYKLLLSALKDAILGESNLITEDGIDIALCDGNDTLIAYN